jgi:hypothetical protein
MLARMIRTFAIVLVAVVTLDCALWAQSAEVISVNSSAGTLTVVIKGKVGPVLSGPDPLGINGQSGQLTLKASESLKPIAHTTHSATYKLPAGAITVTAGSYKFTTKSSSKLTFALGSTADVLTIAASGPDGLMVTDTSYLKSGSWTTAVLQHPGVFKPSPQKLTPAHKANGPGSKLEYIIFGETTILGFTGTASNQGVVVR